MRHFLSILIAVLVSASVFAQNKDAISYWNEVLDRYEELCNACLEHRSTKEVKSRTHALQEILNSPVGKMTAEQQKRFTSIQNRYKGINETIPAIQERPLNIVKVDTIRRVEHLTVIDTVFVKEILGEVEILQKMSRRDTIVHIIRQEDAAVKEPLPDTVYIERIPAPTQKVARIPDITVLAEFGILPTPSYGAMIVIGNRYGGYAKFRDSFRHPKVSAHSSSDNRIWATGLVEHGRTAITAGGMIQAFPWCCLYAGAGYGCHELAWEDANGKWLLIDDGSAKGAALDLGILLNLRSLAVSFGLNYTIPGFTDFELGVGLRF